MNIGQTLYQLRSSAKLSQERFAALLYGKGNFGRSICMAAETGFGTDCNGATVGSILGLASGAESIPAYWTAPFNDTLHTSVFGVGTVKISDRVKLAMEHIK